MMHYGEDGSPPYITPYFNGSFSPSLVSLASSSSALFWSDALSQSSNSSDSNLIPCCISHQATIFEAANVSAPPSWPEEKLSAGSAPRHRHHPRRTSARTEIPNQCPLLAYQSVQKDKFVHSLVGKIKAIVIQVSLLKNCALDFSTQIVEAIWYISLVSCRSEIRNKDVLPLRTFVEETLRRSKTSYSTLQVALYYLILIKPHVLKLNFTMEQPDDTHSVKALQCGRRMFLSALILASKYLQDRNYSARAWSKISGLNTFEINQNEMVFLLSINWKLHITDIIFKRWTDIVLRYNPSQPPPPATFCSKLAKRKADWDAVILILNSNLDNIEECTIQASTNAKVQLIVHRLKPSVH